VLCLIVLDRMRNPRNFSPLFFAVGGVFLQISDLSSLRFAAVE
jgi:hypothetical protein